jgi:hypothetical protein
MNTNALMKDGKDSEPLSKADFFLGRPRLNRYRCASIGGAMIPEGGSRLRTRMVV